MTPKAYKQIETLIAQGHFLAASNRCDELANPLIKRRDAINRDLGKLQKLRETARKGVISNA